MPLKPIGMDFKKKKFDFIGTDVGMAQGQRHDSIYFTSISLPLKVSST